MLKFLLRCLFFMAGVALLCDIGLPTRAETLKVDQHTSRVNDGMSGRRDSSAGDTSYTLHLIGGEVSSCSVGYAAYNRLHDGDTVEVRSTRLFRQCFRIAHGDEVIEVNRYWRWIAAVIGCVLIATAIGWLRQDEDGISLA